MSIIPSWQLHEPVIDLVFVEANTIFAVCKNGLYELPIKNKIIEEQSNVLTQDFRDEPWSEPEEVKLEDSDEEIICGTPGKKPCVTSSRVRRKELFRVKYETPILCCCQNGSTLYTLHASLDERENFVKATDLKTFECDSNVVVSIQKSDTDINDYSWMAFDKSRIFVNCFGRIFRCSIGPGGRSTDSPVKSLTTPSKYFVSKLHLYLEHEIKRPVGSASDLISQIIDAQKATVKDNSNILCPQDIVDLAFMNNDTLLLLSNQGQLLQYSKSHGRELEKTEYPIAHVKSFILTQANGLVVLTKYGAIYRCGTLPKGPKKFQKHSQTPPPTKSFKGLLRAAKDLEELNAEREKLEEELVQLNTFLSGTMKFMVNEITVIGNNESSELEFSIVNESDHTLYGKYWRLGVSMFCCSTIERMPMSCFGRNMTWRVKVPVVRHVQISNLPLKVKKIVVLRNESST